MACFQAVTIHDPPFVPPCNIRGGTKSTPRKEHVFRLGDHAFVSDNPRVNRHRRFLRERIEEDVVFICDQIYCCFARNPTAIRRDPGVYYRRIGVELLVAVAPIVPPAEPTTAGGKEHRAVVGSAPS